MTTIAGPVDKLEPNFFDMQPLGHEVVEVGSLDREAAIANLRHFLVSLTTDTDQTAEVERVNAAYAAIPEYTREEFWVDGDEPLQVLAGVSDKTLRGFAHVNYNYYQRLQETLMTALPKVDMAVANAAERLHQKGHLPEESAVMISNVISEIPAPRAIDPFDAAYRGLRGFCTAEAAIGLHLETDSRLNVLSLTHTRFHELVHAAGVHYGKGFVWVGPSSILLEEVSAAGLTYRAFDESDEYDKPLLPPQGYPAETELVTMLLGDGDGIGRVLNTMYTTAVDRRRRALSQDLDDRTRLLFPAIKNGWKELNESYASPDKLQSRRDYVLDLIEGAWRNHGIETSLILGEDEAPSDGLPFAIVPVNVSL